MLLPLGSPLPDDSVVAKRAESGMLGGLTVPLTWGVAVPADDYDHWAPESEDDVDAVRLYRSAADQGHPTAQNNLGTMYECGTGVTQNFPEALKWYKAAASNGDENAKNNIMVMRGKGMAS